MRKRLAACYIPCWRKRFLEINKYEGRKKEMRMKISRKGLKINISKENSIAKRIYIRMHIRNVRGGGVNNHVYIGKNAILSKVKVQAIGSNNKIVIDDDCNLHNCLLRTDGENNLIVIGQGTSIGGACINASYSTAIKIGRKCMFSSEIDIRSGEHPIYNLSDRKQINFGKDIKIGNYVWIGKRVQCLKGVEIPNNSVVGAGSLVTKKFKEPNVIIAGHPAKVIRTGIYWKR